MLTHPQVQRYSAEAGAFDWDDLRQLVRRTQAINPAQITATCLSSAASRSPSPHGKRLHSSSYYQYNTQQQPHPGTGSMVKSARTNQWPRVNALHFIVEHGDSIDYSKAKPLSLREGAFDVQVEKGSACFTMKDHYAAVGEAREEIQKYIDALEFEAALRHGPFGFKLRFDRADIEDCDPAAETAPSPNTLSVSFRAHGRVRLNVQLKTVKNNFPQPPTSPVNALDPDVQRMLGRYLGYRQRREPLSSMAYFCITVLEASAGRRMAAKKYGITLPVLNKLSRLSSTKGGLGARKAEGIRQELTKKEKQFLEDCVKVIIRRAAEVAHDPKAAQPKITMANFSTNGPESVTDP